MTRALDPEPSQAEEDAAFAAAVQEQEDAAAWHAEAAAGPVGGAAVPRGILTLTLTVTGWHWP